MKCSTSNHWDINWDFNWDFNWDHWDHWDFNWDINWFSEACGRK